MLLAPSVHAQNVVPNPSFSEFITCPNNPGELNKAKYWYNPTNSSTDYFHSCYTASTTWFGTPGNYAGYQVPTSTFEGGGYIGMVTYSTGSSPHEYARTNIPALMPGQAYKVLMRISLSDSFYLATHAPGIFFFVNADTAVSSLSVLPYTPQVTFTSAGHITDKVNWVTLIDTFVADSAYTHLIIGNFTPDASVTSTPLPGGSAAVMAHYYIDSVSVEKIITSSSDISPVPGVPRASLYPNPASGNATLTLIGTGGQHTSISFSDAMGRQVWNMESNAPGRSLTGTHVLNN